MSPREYFFDELDPVEEHNISRAVHASTMGLKSTTDQEDRRVYEKAMAVVGQKRKERDAELATQSASQNPSASSSSTRFVQEVRGGKAQKGYQGESAMDAAIRQNQAAWAYDGSWLQGDYSSQPQSNKRQYGKGHGSGKRHKGNKGGSKGK